MEGQGRIVGLTDRVLSGNDLKQYFPAVHEAIGNGNFGSTPADPHPAPKRPGTVRSCRSGILIEGQ